MLLLGAGAIAPFGDFIPETAPWFWGGISVMSLGFIGAWGASLSSVWFWTIAILARLLLLPMYPGDDVWRYLWEGYIQTQGFSPYNFAPNAAALISYQTQWWGLINHPGVSAIYPPVAQIGFRILAAIASSVLLFKVAFVLADLGICWLLMRSFGPQKTTLYAWNPLVIYSFAGGAHYDSWFILPLVAAWLVSKKGMGFGVWGRRGAGTCVRLRSAVVGKRRIYRWVGCALLLGVSIALKWMSLPILGFLTWQAWRRVDWKLAIAVSVCGLLPLGLSAIPFCSSGECPLIPTGSVFVSYGRSAELLPHLVGLVWEQSRRANWIYLFPLGLAGIWLLWKARNFRQFTEGFFFWLLVISPIIHAWYFTWLVPFAVPTQNLGVRLVSISGFVYFALPFRQALGNSSWYLTDRERAWLWLPFIFGSLWTARKKIDSVVTKFRVTRS